VAIRTDLSAQRPVKALILYTGRMRDTGLKGKRIFKNMTEVKNSDPLIIQRPDHIISRKQIDPDAIKVLYRLYRNGFKAYLVGGAVRDILIGKTPKDFDIVTDAHPGQIKKLFANCFLIGRRFRLAHIRFKGGKIIEVATFRKEPEESSDGGGHDRNNTFGTLIEDAFRRDITINALYYDISNFSIIDHVGGLEDIRKGRICIVGDPGKKYKEDPVRIWRALRHSARTGFSIEKDTGLSIVPHRDLLGLCSGSRLFEELNKDLKSGFARPLFDLLYTYGLLPVLFGRIGEFYSNSQDSRADMVRCLDVMDGIIRSGGSISHEAMLVIISWPWALHVLQKNRQLVYDKSKFLNDAFIEAQMVITIPKCLRAHIVQIIYILDHMMYAMETGRIRWSLKKRARYMDASIIYSIIKHGRIVDVKDPFEADLCEAFNLSPKKKRFSKRRSGRTRRSRASGRSDVNVVP